jgi:hypothetical protein
LIALVSAPVFIVVVQFIYAVNYDDAHPPPPRDYPLAGENGIVALDGVTACRRQATFDRLLELYAKDRLAYTKLLIEMIVPGECIALTKGQKVEVEHLTWTGRACVRKLGDTDCWYTANKLLRRDLQQAKAEDEEKNR